MIVVFHCDCVCVVVVHVLSIGCYVIAYVLLFSCILLMGRVVIVSCGCRMVVGHVLALLLSVFRLCVV